MHLGALLAFGLESWAKERFASLAQLCRRRDSAFGFEVYSVDWSRKDFLASACGDNRLRIFRPEDCPHTCQGSSIGIPILTAGPFGRSRRQTLAPPDCWLKTATISLWIVLPAPQPAGGVYCTKCDRLFPWDVREHAVQLLSNISQRLLSTKMLATVANLMTGSRPFASSRELHPQDRGTWFLTTAP